MAALNKVLNLSLEFVTIIGVVAVVTMEATIFGRIPAIRRRLHLPRPFHGRIILYLEQDVANRSSERGKGLCLSA